MTKKDYELIARLINEMSGHNEVLAGTAFSGCAGRELRDEVAKHFASGLRSTNQRFNRERFLKACGVE